MRHTAGEISGAVKCVSSPCGRIAGRITYRHWVVYLLEMKRWRRGHDRLVADVELVCWHHAAHTIDKLECVRVRPEVDVDCVQRVVIDVLVKGVISRQVPFFLIRDFGKDHE